MMTFWRLLAASLLLAGCSMRISSLPPAGEWDCRPAVSLHMIPPADGVAVWDRIDGAAIKIQCRF